MNVVRDPAVDTSLDKWRSQWPEWAFAEPFIAPLHRERAIAWFALRDELTHAAWFGSDPRPGEMKLAWWAEELQGWSRGVRRHPLGIVLQREQAAWTTLAATLPVLIATRDRPATAEDAFTTLEPFGAALSNIAATLFNPGEPAPAKSVVAGMLGERVLVAHDAAAPLESLAQAGQGAQEHAAARLWAGTLLEHWPLPHGGSLPGRLHASMVRERLQRYAAGGAPQRPLSGWRALWTAWKAARR